MIYRRASAAAFYAAVSAADGACAVPLVLPFRSHRPAVRPRWRAAIAFGSAVACGFPALRAVEIPHDYHVPLTPETAIIGHYSATKKPVLTVKSGAIVRIDGGGGQRWREDDPNKWLKENGIAATIESSPALAETIKVLKDTPYRLPAPSNTPPGTLMSGGGHMLVGPIAIE